MSWVVRKSVLESSNCVASDCISPWRFNRVTAGIAVENASGGFWYCETETRTGCGFDIWNAIVNSAVANLSSFLIDDGRTRCDASGPTWFALRS